MLEVSRGGGRVRSHLEERNALVATVGASGPDPARQFRRDDPTLLGELVSAQRTGMMGTHRTSSLP